MVCVNGRCEMTRNCTQDDDCQADERCETDVLGGRCVRTDRAPLPELTMGLGDAGPLCDQIQYQPRQVCGPNPSPFARFRTVSVESVAVACLRVPNGVDVSKHGLCSMF